MTAATTLAQQLFGQASPSAAEMVPILTSMAATIDTNNLTAGGTIAGPLVITGLLNISATDAISSAGSNQATGTQLTTNISNVATVTAGQGVNLQASTAGMFDAVLNTGTAIALAYPVQGGTDTINGFAATIGAGVPAGAIGFFTATKAGVIEANSINPKKVGYVANTASAAATLTAASFASGEVLSVIDMTGSLSGDAALTTPTVAALLPVLGTPSLNTGYVVRIENHSAGAKVWTLTGGTGVTIVGTATVAQTTWRDFAISFINGTSIAATDIGGGSIV